MCGLFAGVGKLNSNRIIALGSMNESRGGDSVGLGYIDQGKVTIAKIAERPCVALNLSLKKAVTEAAVSGMFIGHTRQATQGSVCDKNAHPFLMDGIAFAHNGIIINDKEFGEYEVDSESLIHGIKAKDFSKYEGPIALVWIQDGKLKAYRGGNPLYRGRHNGSTYLASSNEYLKAIGCTHVRQLAEGLIYTFHTPNGLTTERVSKNKTFASLYSLSSSTSYYTHGGWEGETKQNHLAISQGELLEDFRTNKDMSTKAYYDDMCDQCGTNAELIEGICLECISWMDDNGVGNKDVPPSLQVH